MALASTRRYLFPAGAGTSATHCPPPTQLQGPPIRSIACMHYDTRPSESWNCEMIIPLPNPAITTFSAIQGPALVHTVQRAEDGADCDKRRPRALPPQAKRGMSWKHDTISSRHAPISPRPRPTQERHAYAQDSYCPRMRRRKGPVVLSHPRESMTFQTTCWALTRDTFSPQLGYAA